MSCFNLNWTYTLPTISVSSPIYIEESTKKVDYRLIPSLYIIVK